MFEPHPLRGVVLGEVHARPFHPVATPCRILHFAFLTGHDESAADRAALAQYCASHGLEGPAEGAKHHRVAFGGGSLRWEQHSEFTTYSWEFSAAGELPFQTPAMSLAAVMQSMPQPGPHLVSVDLHLLGDSPLIEPSALFDEATLVAVLADGGSAKMATDFRPGGDGFVRVLVLDGGMTPYRAGALCQRLIEIETYRTLALLGLPEAQRLAPSIRMIEESLARIARDMTATDGLEADQKLLDELTALAARLEADAAVSSYRFGASRAYYSIVQQRIGAIAEQPLDHLTSISAFLSRRMAPAMRTCQMLEERQANLSQKLSRAANLLRTRVDVFIERQNRDLLATMSERTRLQLRLQQTVEGLSVAAISYYVVGLAGYLFKGLKEFGIGPDPAISTTIAVPVAIIGVALVVRSIRKGHDPGD